jgi:hypothetical protein
MTHRFERWLGDPLCLLCITAALLAFVVQSGELGTTDTAHRLQTTHWIWTSEPQVFPNEYPEFGLHGREGHLYSWYGIGQSLLMIPGDLLGTWIENQTIFSTYSDDPQIRSIVVSYFTSILVNTLTALIAYQFLFQLRFSTKESVAGVLTLLFCTTHLHYTQNMMENNYIMLLTLTGFLFQSEWVRTASQRALFIGSCALGLNLLTRLTTVLDLIAVGVFISLSVWLEGVRGQHFWQRLIAYCKLAAPVYLLFLTFDRAYQYYRFGSFTDTYVTVFAREYRILDPTLPANFPWSTPFRVGFFGPLFQPEKSIFLFDPLLLLAIVLLALLWKHLTPQFRANAAATLLLLLAYLSFYARYTYWSGDSSWGDRYVSTAVELVILPAVPLLLRYRRHLGGTTWRAALATIIVSLTIQLASLAFWLPLEIYQMKTLGHPTFVVALRFKNIVAYALGKMNAWGLNSKPMTQDTWDYVHITTWNFLPFLLRRVGAVPGWAMNLVLAIWFAGVAALVLVLLRLRSSLVTLEGGNKQHTNMV